MSIFKRLFGSEKVEEGTNEPHVTSLSPETRKIAEQHFGNIFYFDEAGYKVFVNSILANVDAGYGAPELTPEAIAAYREMSEKTGW